jgi:hypothetical protein
MTLQPARKLEAIYWLLCLVLLAILCGCSEKEEYGPDLQRFAKLERVYGGVNQYEQFVRNHE